MSNPTGKNQFSGGRTAMAQANRNLQAQGLREARRITKQYRPQAGVLKSIALMQAEADLHHARSKRRK
mgnify:FL=1